MNQRTPEDEDQARNEVGDERDRESLTFWQIVASTLAAAFGVQSSRNRERDFSRGKPHHFILAGVVFTVLFVLLMIFIVSIVLRAVG
jgi:hypothetical protein